MFGYLTPALNVLTDEQKNRYRLFYCGLCRSLERYGQKGRMTLSHDMTFLAILLSSLYDPACFDKSGRCALHPFRPGAWETSSMIGYAADMNLLLFYYKCLDSKKDENSLPAKTALSALRKPVDGIRKRYPLQSETVEKTLNELWDTEQHFSGQVDLLCNLSGTMLASVFVPRPEDFWASGLYAVGESLGRFIYWMDAYEDYDEDQKRHRFNPLSVYHDRPDYHDFCHDTLEVFISEAVAHFETLPLIQDTDILRNILYSGAWQRYMLIENKRKRKEDARGE